MCGCNKEDNLKISTQNQIADKSESENQSENNNNSKSENNNNSKDEKPMQINNEFDTSKYEPEVTARLSKDPSEANGKKLTRCEYRYVDKMAIFSRQSLI